MGQSTTSIPHTHYPSHSELCTYCASIADSNTDIWYRGGFIQYLLDRDDIQKPWKEYTEHIFVQKMGDGSLPAENYKYYLIQDYLFLVGFRY